MSVLDQWINPTYLRPRIIKSLKESVLAKPDIRYLVLDNFFSEEALDQLIEQHKTLSFDEKKDRTGPNGEWLPYDSAVCWATEKHFGSELFFSPLWHQYVAELVHVNLKEETHSGVKLRWHRPYSDGFWIHRDDHKIAILAYFNKEWRTFDGGLLQLWRVDEGLIDGTPTFENPEGRLDFLSQHKRIRTSTPGSGFLEGRRHDLILVDQICPEYNRVVICNFETDPVYHSVTPSNGRERTGFVQWLYKD